MNTRKRVRGLRQGQRAALLLLALVLLPMVLASVQGGETLESTLDASGGATQVTKLTAIWANDGEDKVTRDERRASLKRDVRNLVWDGSRIRLFGARNEVVACALILETGAAAATNVSVSLNKLTGPGGAVIASRKVTGDGVFDWLGRQIELFYLRYLPIKGLSLISYGGYYYDERHVPKRLRRPWSGAGEGRGTWFDRPDHDKYYPDIAVPLELVGRFTVPANQNQGIWIDIYIPRTAPAGLYQGTVAISEEGVVTRQLPLQLQVRNFALPETPSARTMVFIGYQDINRRYTGVDWPEPGSPQDLASKLVRDRHFLLAHRHRLSLIDSNDGSEGGDPDQPRPVWRPRLDGSLFSTANRYDGPGVNVGNQVFSIGTYGSWFWQDQGQTGMWRHSDAWVKWFAANFPKAEYFLYLIDEPADLQLVKRWTEWIAANPGPGKGLKSFTTYELPPVLSQAPKLSIAASWATIGPTAPWENALKKWKQTPGKRFFMYNGTRPATGSFATEDDGVALRVLAWTQYKKGIDRWFFWESTYYNNFHCNGDDSQTDVFRQAHTYGCNERFDAVAGRTGYNYSNGDGVLFYPGTDRVFPASSYGIKGPIASLRLKHWRRGIQDVDYLTLAQSKNPTRVRAMVNAAVPKVVWEYGVDDPSDPTYVHADISWSTNPDLWESRRMELANIIDGQQTPP
jgi:hypothetical protein